MAMRQPILSGAPARVPAAKRRTISVSFDKLALFAGAFIVYGDAFSGALRYFYASIGIPYLSYAPFLFGLFTIVLLSLRVAMGGRHLVAVGAGWFAVIFSALLSLWLGRGLGEVLFGLYIAIPLFLGIAVIVMGQERALYRHLSIVWLIAVVGVALDSVVDFPWYSTNFEVLGLDVQAARQWSTFGIERLAGFSRASFAAANQIALGCAIILCTGRGLFKKFAVFSISIGAILLTTSKTPLVIVALLPLALAGFKSLSLDKRSSFGLVGYQKITIGSLLFVVVALPLVEGLARNFISSTRYGIFQLASMFDRAGTTWPRAFELLNFDGNPFQLVLGRGVGGIGAAQVLNERAIFNPADNLFVYLYVSIGCASLAVAWFVFAGISKWSKYDRVGAMNLYAMSVIVVGSGIASNVIEASILCLALGLIVGKVFANPEKRLS